MDLINKQVEHKKYGTGTTTGFDGNKCVNLRNGHSLASFINIAVLISRDVNNFCRNLVYKLFFVF